MTRPAVSFAVAIVFGLATSAPASAETITECIECTTTCDDDGENCVTRCTNVPCPHQDVPSIAAASFQIDDLRSSPSILDLDPTSTPFLMLDGRVILAATGSIRSGLSITTGEAKLLTAAAWVGDAIELSVEGKVVEVKAISTKTGFDLCDLEGTGKLSVTTSK